MLDSVQTIITCVNYDDYLDLSLKHNIDKAPNIHVATVIEDQKTTSVCSKYGVRILFLKTAYNHTSKYLSHSKAINEAYSQLENKKFVLLLDADIILRKPISEDYLNVGGISCMKYRVILRNFNDYYNFFYDKSKIRVMEIEKNNGYGYFQLFDSDAEHIKNKEKIYDESILNGRGEDTNFSHSFKNYKELIKHSVHLGTSSDNWWGRVTKTFKQ